MSNPLTGFSPSNFNPPAWLRNSHAQTIYSSAFAAKPCQPYRRERITLPDGDFLDLDWLDGSPGSPVVLACHGLEGCSRSPYILRLMEMVRRQGWTGAVMHFRTCGGEPNRLLRSYHSGETTDLEFVVKEVIRRNPSIRLFFAGFSLGGNVLAKYLGEQGSGIAPNVTAACAISVPFDLHISQQYIDQGFSRIYTYRFLRTLRKKALEKTNRFPSSFDLDRVLKSTTFAEFDDAFTAPIHGFDGYIDYYTRSSSKPLLRNIHTPTLFISALDDPLIPPQALPEPDEINPKFVKLRFIQHGGHVGFLDRVKKEWWLSKEVMNWFGFLADNAL